MSLQRKVYNGAIFLSVGQISIQGLSLLRNIIVARLLCPDDMGIATTFAMTISFLEMISNLAVDLLLVQSKQGNEPAFQSTAHTFQVVRGCIIAVLIYASAPVIVFLFNTPEAEWAYRTMAIVPLFRGFFHLDWKRSQREMVFLPSVLVETIPQAISAIIAFPMVFCLKDYSAVLWIVIIQAFSGLVVSHICSQRRFQLAWDVEHANYIVSFGWPLLINGLLMFGALQGDRFIVGTFYGMSELGVYSLAFSLYLVVTTIFSKINISLTMPLLSNVQHDKNKFNRRHLISVQIMALIGGITSLVFIFAGGQIVILVFGAKYNAVTHFAPLLGGLIAARIVRLAPTTAALSLGDSKNSMYANLYRMTGLLLGLLAGAFKAQLYIIVLCGILGEITAFGAAVYRLKSKFHLSYKNNLYAPSIVGIILILAGICNYFFFNNYETFEPQLLYFCFAFLLIIVITALILFHDLRNEIKRTMIKRFPNGFY